MKALNYRPAALLRAVILSAAVCFTGLLEQRAAAQPLAPEFVGALEELRSRVVQRTLPNGVRVLFYKRGIAPVFGGVVTVRVGGIDEPAGRSGASHIFEHMAFKGTSTIGTTDYRRERVLLQELERLAPRERDGSLTAEEKQRWEQLLEELKRLWVTDEFTREYEKRGASGMNATTGSELTQYFVALPRNAFEFWCRMESDRLIDPVMRQFYQERDVVLEERRMRYEDSPGGKLYELLISTAFREHPYRHPVIGYASDVRRLTASEVDLFRQRYYVASNIVVALVGDVDPERDLPMVERYFGRIPNGGVPGAPSAVEPPQEGQRDVVLEHPSSPEMYVAYRKPVYPHPDDAPLSVLSEYLAGSAVSPLIEELVRGKKLASSVRVDEGPGGMFPNLLIFSLTPRAPHTNQELLDAFDRILDRVIAQGIPPERLKIAKRSLAVEYLNTLRSDLSLARDLASSEALYGSWESIVDWFERVMRVDSEDVARVAGAYLRPSSRTVARLETKRENK